MDVKQFIFRDLNDFPQNAQTKVSVQDCITKFFYSFYFNVSDGNFVLQHSSLDILFKWCPWWLKFSKVLFVNVNSVAVGRTVQGKFRQHRGFWQKIRLGRACSFFKRRLSLLDPRPNSSVTLVGSRNARIHAARYRPAASRDKFINLT